MTPFLHFRMWWRRAPLSQRGSAALSLAIVASLLVWIALPPGQARPASDLGTGPTLSGGPAATGPTAPAAPAAPAGAGTAPAATFAPGATVGVPAGPAGPAAPVSAGPPAAVVPSGAASPVGPGGAVSRSARPSAQPAAASSSAAACSKPTRVNVGVVLDDVAGLNSTFGIPSPAVQQSEFNAAFDAVNKSGTAGCVTFVGDFQTYNEFDTSTAHTACIAFQSNHDFAVLNGFLPTGTDDCPMQNHIPLFEVQPIGGGDVQKFSPYYFSSHEEFQVLYRNFAYATQQMGVWKPENGFKKLGILYRDCQADVNAALLSDLAAVGVTAVSKFDVGCPANFASPAVLQQAITQFKAAGVTHATLDNDLGDMQNFTKLAQEQGFKPRWVLADYGISGESQSPGFQPDPDNFDGAIGITADQYGAVESGLPDTAGTKACDAVMTSHGQGKVHSFTSGYPGVICNTVWMFAAALAHAPRFAPDQLAAGLQKAPPIDFAYPFGPNDFHKPGTTVAGEYWRPISFHKSCTCWHVDDATFKPSF